MVATNKELVLGYLTLRDFRAVQKKAFETKDKKVKAAMEKIEAELGKRLRESESDSIRTEAGTFYRQVDITPRGDDWQAFYNWVAAEDAFDALERRIKKTFIAEYMEQNNGDLPPGVSVFREYVVRVRKGE